MNTKTETRRQRRVMIALVISLGAWGVASGANALIDDGARAHDLFCAELGSLR